MKSPRPVWDRAAPPKPAPPSAPVPPALPAPPSELFARRTPLSPASLPRFDDAVPGDVGALIEHMRDLQDTSDAIAALKAAGLIGGTE